MLILARLLNLKCWSLILLLMELNLFISVFFSLISCSEVFVNAGEAFYPFGDVEPFLEFGFNDGIDFATPAGLLDGESAVFSAVLLICFPFRPVFRKHCLDLVHGVVNDGLAEFAFPNCDCTPADGF